jgi:hypothetical protein
VSSFPQQVINALNGSWSLAIINNGPKNSYLNITWKPYPSEEPTLLRLDGPFSVNSTFYDTTISGSASTVNTQEENTGSMSKSYLPMLLQTD